MAEKRRGVLALVAGCGVLAIRGADEAAALFARGVDELLYGSSKSGDEAASTGSKVATGAKRYYRQKRIESLLRDVTADESFTLPPGYFAGYRIEPGHRAQLSYEFRTARGRPIDVFLFDERQFLSYRSGGDVSLTSGVRLGRNAGEGERTLERDTEYVLVFDHTDAGVAGTAESSVTVDTDVALAVY